MSGLAEGKDLLHMRAFDGYTAPRDALRERGFVLGMDARRR